MRPIVHSVKIQTSHGRLFACAALISLQALATAVCAGSGQVSHAEAELDSVYSWGIWELGLEPVPSPQAPADGTMNDRSKNVKFRPNANAAYMIRSVPVASETVFSSPLPLPSSPPLAQPVTIGPPGFSSGAPSTADPRN